MRILKLRRRPRRSKGTRRDEDEYRKDFVAEKVDKKEKKGDKSKKKEESGREIGSKEGVEG